MDWFIDNMTSKIKIQRDAVGEFDLEPLNSNIHKSVSNVSREQQIRAALLENDIINLDELFRLSRLPGFPNLFIF